MSAYSKLAGEIVTDASLMFLAGGAVVALIVGVWMIVNAETLFEFNRYLGRWFSVRQASRPLTRPIKSEPFIYRHNRIFGGLILFGSGYVLYQLAFKLQGGAVRRLLLGNDYALSSLNWMVTGLLWALALGSAAALVVGVYLFVRPSLLKGVESWGNKWMTARRSTRFLDIMRIGPEPVIAEYPRVVGTLIVIASLYILVVLWHYWH